MSQQVSLLSYMLVLELRGLENFSKKRDNLTHVLYLLMKLMELEGKEQTKHFSKWVVVWVVIKKDQQL